MMFVLDFTTPEHLTIIVGLHLLNLSIALQCEANVNNRTMIQYQALDAAKLL